MSSDPHAHDSHGADHEDHGHDAHGQDEHGHAAGHGHDDHAHKGGPDLYIVNPSSEPVAGESSTALAYVAFFAFVLLLAAIVKMVA